MPIRFRCHHCNQLLGIARRKAGAHVRCPTCHNDVAVPPEDDPADVEAPALPVAPAPMPAPVLPPGPAPAPALFDRDDFEQILHGALPSDASRSRGSAVRTPVPVVRPQPAPALPPPVQPPAWEPSLEPTPVLAAGGLVLSPARATVLTVVVILLLAVAFALGLVVGRFVL